MIENELNRDWGLCRQTFDILCTLTRLGLKFKCPLQKLIRLQVKNDGVQAIEDAVYRRVN